MAKLLSDYEFAGLVETDDPFRLAVRGHAALEALLGAALSEALGAEELPDVVRRASLPLRLELAVRLGLITEQGSRGMTELGKLRNAFAHGDLDDTIPSQRLSQLADAMRPLLFELESHVRGGSPTTSFRIVLIALHMELQDSIAVWRAGRDAQLEALRRERDVRARELTPEFIAKLLEEADTAPDD